MHKEQMVYRIEQDKTSRESFGEYTYKIFKDTKLVAKYWHDYRGDEHGIEFINGKKEEWPVGRMTEFIEGGGPKPLALSERAIEYLNKKAD
jgi:hypothetical protein